MAKRSEKPTMMRFEPQSGWSEAPAPGQVISINEHMRELRDTSAESAEQSALEAIPSDTLVDIGESMQEVFESLKISDPRLQAWTQVNAAIRLISGKLQERKTLQERITTLETEIEGVRSLAAELVGNAYRSEQEIHETSKLRMQIAEELSQKLTVALKS
jgi:DNA repair ATPase RecN